MTIYISPNPGKTSANEIALRAAQILMNHGAAVLMCEQPRASCSTAGVVYLPLEECLEQADVILTIAATAPFCMRQIFRFGTQSRSWASIWDAVVFWLPAKSARWKPSSPLLHGESSA